MVNKNNLVWLLLKLGWWLLAIALVFCLFVSSWWFKDGGALSVFFKECFILLVCWVGVTICVSVIRRVMSWRFNSLESLKR